MGQFTSDCIADLKYVILLRVQRAVFEILWDSPIHLDWTWSRLSCPEPLQIWRPSEQTFLERDFGKNIRLIIKAYHALLYYAHKQCYFVVSI